ncbi:sulfotransferase domain-containing protein [Salinibacter sp.]|uniref:sulfotransferase domain-containing protein n=1 Tax=Salinibacter sp. TaxID=2065818 RepID=UPI0021E81771|nr:sulfotransferase domain-containing protein [Salinibacter sp.]
MITHFIGIGPPKTGTTWIFKNLKSHPKLFLPSFKESHFWTKEKVGSKEVENYKSCFSEVSEEKLVGEISTDYFHSSVAAKNINRYHPDVLLFTVLRNPIDQIQSHYWHLQRQQFHQWTREGTPNTLEEALHDRRIRELLVEPALYAKHLARWLSYFDRDQLLILFFEDMKQDSQGFLRQIFNHIGVEPSFQKNKLDLDGSTVRGGTSPRSDVHERVRAFLYEKLVRKVYHPLKKKIGVYSAKKLKEMLRVREILDWLFRKKGYPEMKPATKNHLKTKLHDDVRSLEELTGRDLSHWIPPRD